MELSATDKTMITQAIDAFLESLYEIECLAGRTSYPTKQAIINEQIAYRRLKKRICTQH